MSKKFKRKVFSVNRKTVINPKKENPFKDNTNSFKDSTNSSDSLFGALLFMSLLRIRKKIL